MIGQPAVNPLAAVRAGDSSSTMSERRQSPRHTSILKAARVGGETRRFKPAWLARVVDISTGGLAIHLGEQFEIGTILTISLHDSSGQRVRKVEVTVRHAQEQANGTWVLGAEFVTPLTDAELGELLS